MSLWRISPGGAASATSWPLRGSSGSPVSSAAHGPVASTTCSHARRSPPSRVTPPRSTELTAARSRTFSCAASARVKPAGVHLKVVGLAQHPQAGRELRLEFRRGRAVRVVEQERALARDARRREALLQLDPELAAVERQLALGARPLVADEHVALADSGRAARDRAAVEQQHLQAPLLEKEGRRRAADAGADDDGVGRAVTDTEAVRERILRVEQVLRPCR